MTANYSIIVTDKVTGETFSAYTAEDMDEAEGYAEFCRASMPGARVRIDRRVRIDQIEWEEERQWKQQQSMR